MPLTGYVSATFDKVYKNEIPYDDFSATTIDPARWTNYEFVREISGESFDRRSEAVQHLYLPLSMTLVLQILAPLMGSKQNSRLCGMRIYPPELPGWIAIIAAQLYHDGTPGGGLTGDVVAKVSIGGPGESPIAFWLVYRLDDETGWNLTDLAYGNCHSNLLRDPLHFIPGLGWKANHFQGKQ